MGLVIEEGNLRRGTNSNWDNFRSVPRVPRSHERMTRNFPRAMVVSLQHRLDLQ